MNLLRKKRLYLILIAPLLLGAVFFLLLYYGRSEQEIVIDLTEPSSEKAVIHGFSYKPLLSKQSLASKPKLKVKPKDNQGVVSITASSIQLENLQASLQSITPSTNASESFSTQPLALADTSTLPGVTPLGKEVLDANTAEGWELTSYIVVDDSGTGESGPIVAERATLYKDQKCLLIDIFNAHKTLEGERSLSARIYTERKENCL